MITSNEMKVARPMVAAVAAGLAAGLLPYHCQWLYLVGLDGQICQGLSAWWLRPLVLAPLVGGFLGYVFHENWQKVGVAFLLPSIVVRQASFFLMPEGPGNLWPLFLIADLLLAGVTVVAMKAGGKFGAPRPSVEPSERQGPAL